MNVEILFVVPTLNVSGKLKRLVESLKSQSYGNWRILIIDGGSTKEDLDYIKSLALLNVNITYENEREGAKSIYGAMNQGWKQSKQDEWVIFWGADDWAPNVDTVKEMYKEIEKDKGKSDIMIFEGEYRDKKDRRIRVTKFSETGQYEKTSFKRKLFFGRTPAHQASIFGPKIKTFSNEFTINYKLAADLDYFIKIASKKDLNVRVVDKIIVNIAEGGVSGREIKLKLKEVKLIYKKYFKKMYIFVMIARYTKKLIDRIQMFNVF